MKFKTSVIFILAILIPTAALAAFGLLAVRSEKSIVEKNMRQKYRAIANIVAGEIQDAFDKAPEEIWEDTQSREAVLLEQAALFKDEVVIFRGDAPVGRPFRTGDPVWTQPVAGAGSKPASAVYTIAVYERYPFVFEKLQQSRRTLGLYVATIIFAAVSILSGGFFTLRALSREWHLAQLKSEFVAQLSHDLRRPLTSIRMFSEMLKDNRVDTEDKKQEYYHIISSESDRLTHLANNILDFSRVEAGRVRYKFKEVDIANLVNETVRQFRLTRRGAVTAPEHEGGVTPSPPVIVKVDPDVIVQALTNLLSNAAKYSPPDSEIKVNLVKGKRNIMIEVIDQGSGIPLSEQKKIFQKFYRAVKTDDTRIEGSGLGLNLVKYIVEAHHGRVKVESKEGQGSKFSITLPCA